MQHFQKRLHIKRDTRLADLIIDGKWKWESQRMDAQCRELGEKIGPPPGLTDDEDKLQWMPGRTGGFSLQSAVESMGKCSQDVEWKEYVWWKRHITRYAFISWLAFWGRLPTLDRLTQWGVVQEGKCYLCRNQSETNEHLFFTCSYARKVWRDVMTFCGYKAAPDQWMRRGEWMRNRPKPWRSTLQKEIFLLGMSVMIYMVWRERNARCFDAKQRRPEELCWKLKQ